MTSIRVIVCSLLTVFLAAGPAVAQTAPSPTTTTPTGTTSVSGTTTPTSSTTSAYDRLSIGNRKIARALFDAQTNGTSTGGTGTGTTGTSTSSGPMTLDEIAAMKQSGQGWGRVFKDMQARGLVTEKNLGQVVSRYNRQQRASVGETTTASNGTAEANDVRAARDADDTGRGHGVGSGRHGDRASTQASHGNSGRGSVNSGPGSVNSGRGSSGSGHGSGVGRSK